MSSTHPESTEDFEFIQTPAVPQQSKPAFDCGVRTTLVSHYMQLLQLLQLSNG